MQNRPTDFVTVFVTAAILLQCIASFLVNTRISYFIGDDLNAVALLHRVDFWSFITTPVDIHRIPLHRLVNYVLHGLFPMSFAAATAFMVGCHAASLFVLYQILRRLNPSRINLWLILAYALSGYVVILLHWWSAGLHRLPYILFAIISCYGFLRFHEERRPAFAMLALASGLAAAGFFVKAVLIPAYWAALLFCLMDFRQWKKYSREYVLIAIGLALSLAYVVWYMYDNPYDVIQSSATSEVLRMSLQIGFSFIAQMLLQMRLDTAIAPWINLAFCVALGSAVVFAPRAWRALLMGVLALTANLLIIAGSSRATPFGALIMLIPYYYTELLFLIAIFVTILLRQVAAKADARHAGSPARAAGKYRIPCTILIVLLCLLYAFAGWRTALIDLKPGPDEDHWKSARFVRNLKSDIETVDWSSLNLIDRLVPPHFRFGTMLRAPLATSDFLSWFGWQPQFQQLEQPLGFVDTLGHIQPVIAQSEPVPLHAGTTAQFRGDCIASTPSQQHLVFTPPAPIALDRGYLLLHYQASRDTVANAELLVSNGALRPTVVNFSAAGNRTLVDLSHFWQFDPVLMTGLRLADPGPDVCIHAISVTPY